MTLVLPLALLALSPQTPAQATRPTYLDVPIHVEAPVSPIAVAGDDGKVHLAYHLFLTNWGHDHLVVERVEVLDAEERSAVATLDAASLKQSSVLFLVSAGGAGMPAPRTVPAGRTATLSLWLSFALADDVPDEVLHRFHLRSPSIRVAGADEAEAGTMTIACARLAVNPEPPIVLGPPLRGGPWRASGGAGQQSHHFGICLLDGRGRMPERCAIDFQKVDPQGNILPNPFPDDINNVDFYSNRAEVLAVADALVAFVRDRIPENKPTPTGDENMPVPRTRETSAGNQITLRLANGHFAHYAHLVPGSLRVKQGDRVKKGDVIALLGNSGNSKNPHLHFQVSDGVELNGSEGMPYVFDQFELYGHQEAGRMPSITQPAELRSGEMPLIDAILRFRE